MNEDTIHLWAALKVRVLLRQLMQTMAADHERAAAELRKAAR